MDTSQLSSHCIELLRTHNRVSLGSMGSFMAEDTPATLTKNGHILLPPGRRIFFRESETWNDGLLEEAYGEKEELGALLSDISKKLAREKSVTLHSFGKLRKTREGDVFFVMDKNVSVNPNGFGLVPLSLRPLLVPAKVRCDLPKDTSQAEELQEQETPDQPVQRTTDGPALPVANKKKKKTTVNKPKKKASTGVLVVLTVILVVILCLILIYIFRDSLKPLLEQILYSAEERQLL